MKKLLLFASLFLFQLFSFSQQNWSQIECGTEFSIALRSDSLLFSWGNNANGQLGNNLATPASNSPYLIDTNSKWRTISAGSFHSLGIKNDGTLWAWGFNGNGQIGSGNKIQSNIPIQIGTDTDWTHVDAGLANSFAIKNNGTLWAWGLNFQGQLGIGTPGADTTSPIQVGTDSDWKQISCGGFQVLGMKTNGSLWAWGYNGEGQVGDTSNIDKYIPTLISSDTNWKSISAGYQFSTAIKTNGSIYSWGFNGNGQLGDNTLVSKNYPVDVSAAEMWIDISAGSSFAFAIKSDSTLYGWGYNGSGQLGTGNTTQYIKPRIVDNSTNWLSINAADGAQSGTALFGLHTLGLKTNTTGICFSGANYTGQLGDGTANNSTVFICNQITTALEELSNEELAITVYPNPTRDNFTIEIAENNFETVNYNLVNSIGKTIKSGKVNNFDKIDISSFSDGLYLLILKNNGNVIGTERIIKN